MVVPLREGEKMKKIVVAFAALAAGAVLALPAAAVTDGQPDGNGHPYVALMLAQDENGTPLWRCSGTLMSPTVYVTAGHCTEEPAAHAELFFSAGPIPTDPVYTAARAAGATAAEACAMPGITGYPCKGDVGGDVYTHPDFYDGPFFLHDAGVVVLDRPFASPNGVYGKLPALGRLDTLKPSRSTTFTAVGYGLQKAFPDAAAWKDVAVKERRVAYPHLLQINVKGSVGDFSLLLSANASTGGTCFGDSGGPNFIGSSNVLAGVTSFGKNPTCAGQGGVYRLDTADDLTWLATFGLTP